MRKQVDERVRQFVAFVEQDGLAWHQILSPHYFGARPFIVYSATDLAKVTFSFQGAIRLIARPGRVKDALLAWIIAQHTTWHDAGDDEKQLAELDQYRYVLRASTASPPAEAVPFTGSDHPLVTLAERLGYQVVFLVPEYPLDERRYRVVRSDESFVSGVDLLTTLAEVLVHDLGREEASGA